MGQASRLSMNDGQDARPTQSSQGASEQNRDRNVQLAPSLVQVSAGPRDMHRQLVMNCLRTSDHQRVQATDHSAIQASPPREIFNEFSKSGILFIAQIVARKTCGS